MNTAQLPSPRNTAAAKDQRRVIFNVLARGVDGLVRLTEMQHKLNAICSGNESGEATTSDEYAAFVAEQQHQVEVVTAEIGGLIWAYFDQLGVDDVLAQALAERMAASSQAGQQGGRVQ